MAQDARNEGQAEAPGEGLVQRGKNLAQLVAQLGGEILVEEGSRGLAQLAAEAENQVTQGIPRRHAGLF